MSGATDVKTLIDDPNMDEKSREKYLKGLAEFHSGLEKVRTAEAELSRVRAELARNGVALAIDDSLHW